jgi:hypothetical protein
MKKFEFIFLEFLYFQIFEVFAVVFTSWPVTHPYTTLPLARLNSTPSV